MKQEPLFTRCHCGRPIREATGRCNQDHVWPRDERDDKGRAS